MNTDKRLDSIGLGRTASASWNLGVEALYERAIRDGEGRVAAGGALLCETGQHTGRSPKDKFIVRDAASEGDVNWGAVNQPMETAAFERLLARVQAYMQNRDVYVQDLYAGADPTHRLSVRVVTEQAWHNLFARNMFIRPPRADYAGFQPDYTIIQAPGFSATPEIDGCRSETVIAVSLTKRIIIIAGTSYAGEIKKSVFSLMNHLLPAKGVMPMHCSANIGPKGDAAIFFGLSGTGKTTLSADASRTLIGDDEHGWSANGLFNFEGGCYAKVIDLSATAEPEIFAASHRFGTVLENVVMDPETRMLDLSDRSLTENTRSCYPLDFIPNASETGQGPHPTNIVMLTADAFGVMPPIAKLSPEQAMYHFLSGYTARVAGTEKGLGAEPQATFSTCFGAPFMTRHPTVYAKLLGERIAATGANCWLVNTGWTGGAFGVGKRMSIAHTRAMLRAALDGKLDGAPMRRDPNFGLSVPEACPDVPSEALDPRGAWSDASAYDETARKLTASFEENFVQFEGDVAAPVKAAAIRKAA
ncbi:MAG: phosphoenolpyruvate carboxykinase [Alphaproteobacteria bacterium]